MIPGTPIKRGVAGAVRLSVLAHSSTLTRRAVPVAVPFALAQPYGRRARRKSDPRFERFRSFQAQLLAHTPLAGSEEEVAERQCAEMIRTIEMFWRPWLSERGEIDGLEHFHAARARGRGVAAVFPHFGMPYAHYAILPRFGIESWTVSGAMHFQDLGNGYIGRFARQGRAYIDRLGTGHAVPTGDGGAAVAAARRALKLLRNGATVSVAIDLVGSTPTPFLGRTVSLAGGASGLPYEADAVVAPMVVRRVGHRPVVRFAPPIDPRDYDDTVALQAAVAKVVEQWALELPEAVWPLVHNGTPLIHGPALETASQPA